LHKSGYESVVAKVLEVILKRALKAISKRHEIIQHPIIDTFQKNSQIAQLNRHVYSDFRHLSYDEA